MLRARRERARGQQAIAYYRVSTERQGRSGLGLEAQQATVERFAAQEGFTLAKSFVEIESGGNDDRPQLLAAMAEARRLRCPLMVAHDFDSFLHGGKHGGGTKKRPRTATTGANPKQGVLGGL